LGRERRRGWRKGSSKSGEIEGERMGRREREREREREDEGDTPPTPSLLASVHTMYYLFGSAILRIGAVVSKCVSWSKLF